MCGIVGYIGFDNAKELLLSGLEKLEYRGYDSAGIAVVNDEGTTVFKEKGRIAELRKVADSNDIDGHIGIGHTRWATHGEPTVANGLLMGYLVILIHILINQIMDVSL